MTPDFLRAATGCTQERAAVFAPLLAEACSAYQINTPKRLAAFLAQIGHESGSLRYTAEIWGPTPAQVRYEGRADLGNTQPGDGPRFRGRGLIQTTGRANYCAVRDRLRTRLQGVPDFELAPETLEHPQWAAWSAADYWAWKNLNALADADQFEQITRRINGGVNGQADRLARHRRALSVLTGDSNVALPAALLGLGQVLISALTPLAAEKINKEISRHTDKPEVAEQITTALIESAKTATRLSDPLDAVSAARKDPEALKTVEADGLEKLNQMLLAEVGGGIAAARIANAATNLTPPSKNLALWITLALLPLVYMTVSAVLFGTDWPTEIRAMVVASVVSGVLGAVTGFWLGSSFGSQRKDEQRA